jgi:hypothetical protein
MNDQLARPLAELDRASAFAWFALLAGALSVLLVIEVLQPMPQSAIDLLSYFSSHFRIVALAGIMILTWAVFSIPFVVALGQLLRSKSGTFALTATVLSGTGILLLGFGNFTGIGAGLAIATAGTPPSAADATYQLTIWRNLSFYLTDPGLMTWGLGQLLFGWLAWKGGVLPNWVALVGMIGGAAGLLTLAVYQTSMLALLQLACFAIWGFSTGIVLFRREMHPCVGRHTAKEPQ